MKTSEPFLSQMIKEWRDTFPCVDFGTENVSHERTDVSTLALTKFCSVSELSKLLLNTFSCIVIGP